MLNILRPGSRVGPEKQTECQTNWVPRACSQVLAPRSLTHGRGDWTPFTRQLDFYMTL